MKKLFLMVAFVLLVGCTLHENELDQVLLEIENLAGELSLIEGLASANNFEGVKHRIKSANASLEKIDAWITEAEEKGENPETISRVRSDSEFLSAELKALIINAKLVQKLEQARPLMEALERKEVDKRDPALEAIEEILDLIDKVKQSIDAMDAAAGKAVDKDILDTKGALDKMYAFENEIDLRRNEFVSVKKQLGQVKESRGLNNLS